MKNNIGSAFVRGALAFSFFIYHTRCSLFPCFDCFPIGVKKHTHSLNERDTHTQGAVGCYPFLGCVYSQAFRAQLCYSCTPGERARLSFQKSPLCTHWCVCVFGNCMLQRISGPALTARLLCIMNAMMRQ